MRRFMTDPEVEIRFLKRKIDSLKWQLDQAHELIQKQHRRASIRAKIDALDPEDPLRGAGVPLPPPPIVYP